MKYESGILRVWSQLQGIDIAEYFSKLASLFKLLVWENDMDSFLGSWSHGSRIESREWIGKKRPK